MYNLKEYSDKYSKTSRMLWQCRRDEPVLADNGTIAHFTADSADTNSFRIKQKITGQPDSNSTNLCFFSFASLLGIPAGITSSAIGLETCVIAAGIKKY